MAFYTKANYAFSTLASGIAIDALSLSVAAGTGTKFPAAGTFVCVIWDAQYAVPDQDDTREIIEVTARSTDAFTIVRSRESTTAKAWDTGAKIANVFTAGTAAQYETFESSQTAAAGKIPVTSSDKGDLPLLDNAKVYFGVTTYIDGHDGTDHGRVRIAPNGNTVITVNYGIDGTDAVDIAGAVHATGQLKTTLATGTAPLSITSTTKVDNLNVDQVDNFNASQTAAAASIPVTADTTGNLPLIDAAALLWGDGSCEIAGSGATDIIAMTGAVTVSSTLGVTGLISGPNMALGATATEGVACSIDMGVGRSGNGYAIIDLVGDATYTDYGLRVIRNNTGANAISQIIHRGTGALDLRTQEAAPLNIYTADTQRVSVTSAGRVLMGVSLGTDDGTSALQVNGSTMSFDGFYVASASSVRAVLDAPSGDGRLRLSIDGSNIFSLKAVTNYVGWYIGTTELVRYNQTGNIIDVSGDVNSTGVYKIDGTQVVSNRVIDARLDDVINSGDATTDGVIDALRDLVIAHGLGAAA